MFISPVTKGTERPLPKFKILSNVIDTYLDIVKKRYMNDTSYSSGGPIPFLSSLLGMIDDPAVLKKDMLDVFSDYIFELELSAMQKFDTVRGVPTKRNTFFKGKDTEEIFIPTHGVVGNKATVLDPWSVWKDVQPIKLLAHDSNELKLYWYHQIAFSVNKPTYAIFAIDVEALFVKYILWMRENDLSVHNTRISEFINFEIIPFLYNDLLDIWVSNLLQEFSTEGDDPKLVCADLHIKSTYDTAINELTEYFDKLVRNNYRIGDLLRTKFYTGDRAIVDIVDEYTDVYASPGSNRYIGYTLAKLADITNTLTNTLSATRDRGLETAIIRRLTQDARLLGKAKWSSTLKVKAIKDRVNIMLLNIDTLN